MGAGQDLTASAALLAPIVDRTLHSVMYSFDKAALNPGFVSMKRAQAQQTPFGEAWQMTVEVGAAGSTSGTYSVSDTNMGDAPSTTKKFLIKPATIFTKVKLAGETIDRCADQGGLVQAMSYILKSGMQSHMRKLCVLSAGLGTGAGSTVFGSGALARITAVNASPAYIEVAAGFGRRIELNDKLVAAAAESSGGLRSATALQVTGRNLGGGTAGADRISLSADPTGVSWSAGSGGDFLFWEGMRNKAYKPQFAWCPSTAPSASEDFFGVDRSIDAVRLGGNRKDCTGLTYRQALITCGRIAASEGQVTDRVRMSLEDFAALNLESDELKTGELNGENTTVGFSGVKLAGIPGMQNVVVLPDESLPPGDAIMEDSKAWKCLTKDGNLARFEKADGLLFRPVNGEYAYAATIVSVLQPVCERPGHVLHMFNLGA
jgi:hypothetical protein